MDRAADELGPVVVRVDGDALGQRLLDVGDGALHVGDDLARARAAEHEHHADDRLALATVARHRAVADDRRLVHVAEAACILHPSVRAHADVLAAVDDVRTSGRDVVLLDRGDDLGDVDARRRQLRRIERELEALRLSAERVHVEDAGDETEARCDLPVEDRAAIHQRPIALHLEVEDLADAARHRRELRGAIGSGDVPLRLREALADELPRAIDVGVVGRTRASRRRCRRARCSAPPRGRRCPPSRARSAW